MEISYIIVDSILFILPLWFGNASPTILGGGAPIDRGKYWRDGKRILGDGKTIRGFWAGTLVGGLLGMLVSILAPLFLINLKYLEYLEKGIVFQLLSTLGYEAILLNSAILGFLIGFIQSFGGLIGDLIGSFIKRRSGIKRGQSFIFLDQLGFLVLGMAFVFPLIPWPIEWFLFLVPITFILHIVANLFGYITGIQDVPL
ncbi:MAG: CDP-2,3-bis-(O-geranylgeranyl)-sn-glycerol synthase [Candidatus Hodarchaeales archaeon]